MAFGELYTALENRTVDGQENPYSVILSNKFFEVQKYVSATNHTFTQNIIIVSKKFWDGLSAEEQKMLRDSVRRWAGGDHAASADCWPLFAEMGWLMASLPEDAGGLGGGLEDAAIVAEELGRGLMTLDADDKLAASYPFLTMLSTAVCGWLMERQGRIAATSDGDPAFLAMKTAAAHFYVAQIVPEAMGLKSN